MLFTDLGLSKPLLNALSDSGFAEPTDIQKQAIPKILGGADVLGIAQTGTGKTAAFALPILRKLSHAQGNLPRAIVLAPTRELCQQIADEVIQYSQYTDLRVFTAFGGKSARVQAKDVSEGYDLVVSTPARIMDLYRLYPVLFKSVKFFVLDEADLLMDMGFMPQIRKLLEVIPRKRQNLLFSATFSPIVERLSEEFLEFPLRIEVTPQATPAETVKQLLYPVKNLRTKIELLATLLQDIPEEDRRIIVFCRSRQRANEVFHFLERKVDKEVRVIHANKDQNSRRNSLDAFKEGTIRILVSTGMLARGIDVSQVSHVINFDVPVVYEEYVHRIGRTGRAKSTGIAITFVESQEFYHINRIEEIIGQKIERCLLPKSIPDYETPFAESQEQAKELDRQKRLADPTYQGAFHTKKPKSEKKKKKQSGYSSKNGRKY